MVYCMGWELSSLFCLFGSCVAAFSSLWPYSVALRLNGVYARMQDQ
jgi:hypothetical protein